jgi:hypothetical protein
MDYRDDVDDFTIACRDIRNAVAEREERKAVLIPTSCEFDSRRGFPRGEKSDSMTPSVGGRGYGIGDRITGRF